MQDNNQITNWKKPFFIFWVSQAFSFFGSYIVQFALVWWLTKTTGSASVLAAASTVAIIPEIVISPIAGTIVDRSDRKKVMMLADSLIAVFTILLAVLFYFNYVEIWHVFVVMFIRAVGGAFHYPAEQASISLMVPTEHLARIAGLNQALRGIINIIAPPLGALFLDLINIQGTLAIDFVTAFIAVSFLLVIHVPLPENSPKQEAFNISNIFSDLKSGMRYIMNWKGLFALIILGMVFKIALSPAFSLISLLVNKHFNGDAAQYALVESVSGIGIVAGGILLGIWGGFKKKIWTIWLSLLSVGACLIWICLLGPDQFSFFIPSMFLLSFMVPFIDGPFMAILQAKVSPEFQGRVFTLTTSLLWLTTPIGLGVAGPVSDQFGLQIWYALAGILCILATITGIFLPQVRNID